MTEESSGRPVRPLPDQIFGRMIAFGLSSEFHTPDRLELINTIRHEMARDPGILAALERILGEHEEEIRRVAPTEEELEALGLSGLESSDVAPDDARIAPVAAAAALAPPAAAVAAGAAVAV